MKFFRVILLFILSCPMFLHAAEPQYKRVILFTIDGLHRQVLNRLSMPNLKDLKTEGTYIEESCTILPHHPTVGEYGKLMTTSFPNPVLHAGTLFITGQTKFIQHMWQASGQETAFLTNCYAYQSITPGFDEVVQDENLSDAALVEKAKAVLAQKDYVFMRIHLQTPGNEGRFLSDGDPQKLYFRNIYAEGSPYAKTVEESDRILGDFIAFLKSKNMYDDSLLIITSDHGQSLSGWHPMTDPDSWKTPLLFIGKGIAKGRELPTFEHLDLTPTICHLMGIPLPNSNGATGHFVPSILEANDPQDYPYAPLVEIINQQIVEYNMLRSELFLRSKKEPYYGNIISLLENSIMTPEPFYHQDRFTEWHLAETLPHLIEVNDQLLTKVKKALNN